MRVTNEESSVFRRSFRPTWQAFALALLACAAGVALGNWQSRRAEERRLLAQRIEIAQSGPAIDLPHTPVDGADFALRKVAARGRFVAEHTIFLEFKIRNGRLGFEVLTPLRLAEGNLHVLVNRGWIAVGAKFDVPPEIRTPQGSLRIEGIALERLPQAWEAAQGGRQGKVWQNLRIEEFRAVSGLAVQPLIIEQRSEVDDGLARNWPRVDSGAQKNEMYALQWYSLAALAVILFLVLSLRRESSS
ncbi:MAG: SURF1 family protein [Betaproteobacteria bacterium]|nr:SURF1 family protein [Betaproteobacteria bacterium]